MKKGTWITIFLVLGCIVNVHSQQLGLYSQYMDNAMLLNPSAAGMEKYTDVNLSTRQQWVGFKNAPQTFALSANGRLSEKVSTAEKPYSLRISDPDRYTEVYGKEAKHKYLPHGLGGYADYDQHGPFSRISGYVSYAHHFPLGKGYFLSLGVAPGVANRSLGTDNLEVADPNNDQTFREYKGNSVQSTYFDLNSGVSFYSDRLYVGYSGRQLLQNALFAEIKPVDEDQKLVVHHSLISMYRFRLNSFLELAPTIALRKAGPAPLKYDATAKLRFEEKIWAGFSYREEGTLSGIFGLRINELIQVGYSYDFTTSGLASYNDGSHELNLSFMLFNHKKLTPDFIW